MSLSIGARSADNISATKFLGLTCAPDKWDELPETLKATINQRVSEIQRLYSDGSPYAHYFNNVSRDHRNFLTLHFLHLYENILGWGSGTPRAKHIYTKDIRKNYTANDIENMGPSYNVGNLVPGNRNREDAHQENLVFRVVEIGRGVAAVDKIAEITRSVSTCQTLTNISLACTIDNKHKIIVLRNVADGTYDIITNRPLDAFWQRLLPSMLLSEEQLQEVGEAPYGEDTPASQMRTFCRMLYENRVEEYLAYLQSFTANITTIVQRQLYKKLDIITNTLSNRGVESLTAKISTCERKITEYHNAAQQYLDEQQTYKQQLAGILLNKTEEMAQLTAAFNFIKEHPEIMELKDADTNNGTITLHIKTPIGNWRIKDAEMWFKRSEENYVNRDPKVAAAFKACFVEETFEMLTESAVIFYITSRSSGNIASGDNLWSNPQERLQNVHVGRYNCFSNYKNALQKAMQAQDYYQALMLIIQACSTYTFTDSTVVATLCNNMLQCRGKTYREKATGELFTLSELYAKLHPEDKED